MSDFPPADMIVGSCEYVIPRTGRVCGRMIVKIEDPNGNYWQHYNKAQNHSAVPLAGQQSLPEGASSEQ